MLIIACIHAQAFTAVTFFFSDVPMILGIEYLDCHVVLLKEVNFGEIKHFESMDAVHYQMVHQDLKLYKSIQ
jgi:hypothetical protein